MPLRDSGFDAKAALHAISDSRHGRHVLGGGVRTLDDMSGPLDEEASKR